MWKWVVIAMGVASGIAFATFLHLWGRHNQTALGDTYETYTLIALGFFALSLALGYYVRKASPRN